MLRVWNVLLLLFVCTLCLPAQEEKYKGPRPPKPDVPYLMHADNLVELEVGEAREQKVKDDSVFVVSGAASPAKTPLAEPIFLLHAEKLLPDRLELYQMEVKGGNRQVTISTKRKNTARRFALAVTRLGDHLYRIDVNEGLGLPNGEYSLSPAESNQVFCFAVY